MASRLRDLLDFQPVRAREEREEEIPEIVLSGFERILQVNSNWCWAAVTIAILKLRKGKADETQCDLALEQIKDCTDCREDNCNQRVESLQPVLDKHGIPNMRTGGISFADVKREIADHKKPIALEVSTPEMRGLKHAVVVFGFKEEGGTRLVDVSDPDADGQFEGLIPFDRFAVDCRAKYILQ